ncbi:MAG: MmcQ/YjbR family DNA-binding protein [Isosphaeraceae bacterium]
MKRKPKPNPSSSDGPVTFETVRKLALTLPGVVEGTSYGTPAFRAGKTLFARQHQDGESLVIRIEHDHRAMRMKAAPETFFITDHYLNYPWMLVRLATIDHDDLRDLLEEAWRLSAPKRLLAPPRSG